MINRFPRQMNMELVHVRADSTENRLRAEKSRLALPYGSSSGRSSHVIISISMVELSHCPVCDHHANRHRCTKFSLRLVECKKCGLWYANPRLSPEDIWKRYGPSYFWQEYLPSLGVREGRYDLRYFDARHAAMLRLIEKHHPARGRMLEVGAGAGFFLKAAERAGWDVAGIEVSSEAVNFARTELRLDVRQEPAETMTFPAASFEVAVMFDVIEHLLDPIVSLARIRRALRPGGLLIVSTPNVDALTRFGLGIDWAVLSPAEHLYNFSGDSLSLALQRAGFTRVILERRFDGFGVYETMNPHYTHAPSSRRGRAYRTFVSLMGPLIFRGVQRAGLADTLLAIASVG